MGSAHVGLWLTHHIFTLYKVIFREQRGVYSLAIRDLQQIKYNVRFYEIMVKIIPLKFYNRIYAQTYNLNKNIKIYCNTHKIKYPPLKYRNNNALRRIA